MGGLPLQVMAERSSLYQIIAKMVDYAWVLVALLGKDLIMLMAGMG